ncbi:MAG: hypothetical protein IJT98_03725 [Prevotella sp.]|nr:hypothetical protein [Prevotella sp.]
MHSGCCTRRFRSVPIGALPCEIEMYVRRVKCKDCGCVQQEDIDFARVSGATPRLSPTW